jgi:hypothetical protein
VLSKRVPYRNKKITESARNEVCQLQLDGCRYGGFEEGSTVWAHSPFGEDGKGASQKADDIFGCYACSSCHDIIDGRKKSHYSSEELRDAFHRAMKRSIRKLLDKGIIK